MRFRVFDLMSLALGIVALVLTGCGGDDPTGPEFGDLAFAPTSPIVIGSARQLDLELLNVSSGSLGPLLVGAGSIPLSFPPGSACTGLETSINPSQVQSVAAGRSVEIGVNFSFADLTEEQCPFATYEVDIHAVLGTTRLASAQVRLDHTELE